MRWSRVQLTRSERVEFVEQGWDLLTDPFPLEVRDLSVGDLWCDELGRTYLVVAVDNETLTGHRKLKVTHSTSVEPEWLDFLASREAWLLGTNDWTASWHPDAAEELTNE